MQTRVQPSLKCSSFFPQAAHYAPSLGWSGQQPERQGLQTSSERETPGLRGFGSSGSPDWAQHLGRPEASVFFYRGPHNAEHGAENISWSWTFFKAQSPTTISREHLLLFSAFPAQPGERPRCWMTEPAGLYHCSHAGDTAVL